MNLRKEIIIFPDRFKKIPHPYYVVRCGDHCLVCELDDEMNLIDEVSAISCDVYQVRRWALQIASEKTKTVRGE